MYKLDHPQDPGLGALDPPCRIGDAVLDFETAFIARELQRMHELGEIQKRIWLGAILRQIDDAEEGAALTHPRTYNPGTAFRWNTAEIRGLSLA